MLDALHRDYRPITIKTWIDDIFQLHTGRKEIIEPHAKKAALQLVALARRKRLRISSKSSITSSDPELAQRIQKDLAAEGIHLQVENSSKDLGVDFAGGRKEADSCPAAAFPERLPIGEASGDARKAH